MNDPTYLRQAIEWKSKKEISTQTRHQIKEKSELIKYNIELFHGFCGLLSYGAKFNEKEVHRISKFMYDDIQKEETVVFKTYKFSPKKNYRNRASSEIMFGNIIPDKNKLSKFYSTILKLGEREADLIMATAPFAITPHASERAFQRSNIKNAVHALTMNAFDNLGLFTLGARLWRHLPEQKNDIRQFYLPCDDGLLACNLLDVDTQFIEPMMMSFTRGDAGISKSNIDHSWFLRDNGYASSFLWANSLFFIGMTYISKDMFSKEQEFVYFSLKNLSQKHRDTLNVLKYSTINPYSVSEDTLLDNKDKIEAAYEDLKTLHTMPEFIKVYGNLQAVAKMPWEEKNEDIPKIRKIVNTYYFEKDDPETIFKYETHDEYQKNIERMSTMNNVLEDNQEWSLPKP